MSRRWDPTRYIYEQIADELRNDIRAGRLLPDDKLSEVQLQDTFGVARATIRQALEILRGEGLITTLPGRGSFVLGASDSGDLLED